jgi:hypothetical protein
MKKLRWLAVLVLVIAGCEPYTMTATSDVHVDSEKKLHWSSSDTTIVQVEEYTGVMTPLSAGVASVCSQWKRTEDGKIVAIYGYATCTQYEVTKELALRQLR